MCSDVDFFKTNKGHLEGCSNYRGIKVMSPHHENLGKSRIEAKRCVDDL